MGLLEGFPYFCEGECTIKVWSVEVFTDQLHHIRVKFMNSILLRSLLKSNIFHIFCHRLLQNLQIDIITEKFIFGIYH